MYREVMASATGPRFTWYLFSLVPIAIAAAVHVRPNGYSALTADHQNDDNRGRRATTRSSSRRRADGPPASPGLRATRCAHEDLQSVSTFDHVLPHVPLRQWVLRLPHELRRRIAYDRVLLANAGRIFVSSVLGFYGRHLVGGEAKSSGKSGAVVVVPLRSSDLKLKLRRRLQIL